MEKEKYYVYKFIDNSNDVLYVGKTTNIDSRLYSHIKDKEWLKSGVSLYCSEVKNLTDMDIYETYYINKLKPQYNKLKVYHAEFTQKIDNLNFILYKELKDIDFATKAKNYTDKIILCGTKSSRVLEYSGLPIWQDIHIHESIYLDMKEFLYETNIAKDYILTHMILNTSDYIFSFRFKMHNNALVDINLVYNPDIIIDIPKHVYYDAFLPILQGCIEEFIGDCKHLLLLDELTNKEGDIY